MINLETEILFHVILLFKIQCPLNMIQQYATYILRLF